MVAISRRVLLGSALAAPALATPALAQGRKPLLVEAFGGVYESTLREKVIPEFEKQHGYAVTLVVGDDPTVIPKIVAARNRPTYDVVALNNDSAILLQTQGLFAPDQSAKLGNIGRIYDSMKRRQRRCTGGSSTSTRGCTTPRSSRRCRRRGWTSGPRMRRWACRISGSPTE